jgi:hypothetical protein
MFGEDVHVNEWKIFLSLSIISYSYKNDKWQRTCLIVKQASTVYRSAQLTPHRFFFITPSVQRPHFRNKTMQFLHGSTEQNLQITGFRFDFA